MASAQLAGELAEALRSRPDPGRAAGERKYLRSDLEHIGVAVPSMRGIVSGFVRRHPDLDRDELADLARALWEPPVHEYRLTAALLLRACVRTLTAEDARLVEEFVRQSDTWAHVDVLAGVGAELLVTAPEVEWYLRDWCAEEHQWVRRSGILGFLVVLRGTHRFAQYFPVFGGLVDPLLGDRRFFVRKAIGWVLREAGKRHGDEVYAWTAGRAAAMAGVTLREVVKYLEPEQRSSLLAAHRAGTV